MPVGRRVAGCRNRLTIRLEKNNHMRVYRLPSFIIHSFDHSLTAALWDRHWSLVISGLMRTTDTERLVSNGSRATSRQVIVKRSSLCSFERS